MTTGTSATLGRPTRKYDLQLKRGPPVFFFFPIDDRQCLYYWETSRFALC